MHECRLVAKDHAPYEEEAQRQLEQQLDRPERREALSDDSERAHLDLGAEFLEVPDNGSPPRQHDHRLPSAPIDGSDELDDRPVRAPIFGARMEEQDVLNRFWVRHRTDWDS